MRRLFACTAAALVGAGGVRGQVIVGLDQGGPPLVRVYDPLNPGSALASFQTNDPGFLGGVRVAVGDVNSDGLGDIVTGLGPTGLSQVKVYSGLGGGPLLSFFLAYGPSFTGGVYVAAGDVNGDGYADVVTGPGGGMGPNVKVFSGATGAEIASFFAFSPTFMGGVRVASGDVNGDGYADVICAAGPTGQPQVIVYAGSASGVGGVLHSFFAYTPGFTGGVFVAAADINLDGYDDIITGPGEGFPPSINTYSGQTGLLFGSFLAFPYSVLGGARVAAANLIGGGVPEIIVGAGQGGGITSPQVRVLSPAGGVVTSFLPTLPGFFGAVYVAAADRSCYPDCNDDGVLMVADFACFQTRFVAGEPYADCNGDGARTVADFGCFQTKFVAGCP